MSHRSILPAAAIDKLYVNQQKYKASPRGRYSKQKENAKRRGIPFLLTYDEWWKIWEDSGKWDQRGNKIGSYVMSRQNDEGFYAIGNVYITPFTANSITGCRKAFETRTKHTAKSDATMFICNCGDSLCAQCAA